MASLHLDVLSRDDTSDPVLRLASCLSRSTARDDDECRAAVSGILFNLQQKRPRLHEDLHRQFHPTLIPWDRVAHICCEVVFLVRENHRQSIDQLLEQLQQNSVMAPNAERGPDGRLRMQEAIFSIILVLSRIALPSDCLPYNNQIPSATSFEIDRQGAKQPRYSTIERAKARRPLDEMLRDLGEILPRHSGNAHLTTSLAEQSDPELAKFHVSMLNAAALKAAGVRLIWVDSLAAHLHLNPAIPALYLFRSPSYCALQASEGSFLSLFSSVFYDDGEMADNTVFSIPQLMDEVLSSYALLFRHDNRARRLFRKSERLSAASKDQDGKAVFDPRLDKVCGIPARRLLFRGLNEPFRETYHVAHFPLLRHRLERLHLFMDGIQPSRILSIWRDRRDQRLWWTFWTVLLFGCATILLSLASIGLAVWQGITAQRQLDLAKLQGGKSQET